MFDIVIVLVSIVAGLCVGLTGIGSTLLILPALMIIFPKILPHAVAIKMALATTLGAATIASLFGTISHYRKGNIVFHIVKLLTPVYIISGIVGALIVHYLPAVIMHYIISVMLLLLAIRLIYRTVQGASHDAGKVHSKRMLLTVGGFAGLMNSIGGIATGTIMIPYLHRYLSMTKSSATSLASTMIACGVAFLSYMVLGIHVSHLPPHSWGYVYYPTFIIMAVGIVIFTPIGVWLSHRVHVKWLKILFIVLLLLASYSIFTARV